MALFCKLIYRTTLVLQIDSVGGSSTHLFSNRRRL